MDGFMRDMYVIESGDVATVGVKNWVYYEGGHYPHGEDVLIGQFEKGMPDGQDVDLYCCALPAKFYKIIVHEGKNSVGEYQAPFSLTTGSGEEVFEWAVTTAKLISEGMIGIH